MEARLVAAALAVLCLFSLGAGARSQNFIVQASSPQLAEEICRAAETYRRDLAIEWLGRELPPWSQPCPITAQVAAHLGAGGATSFMFDQRSQPFGWEMNIQGSRERVLDSVLPHEVTHTIFATYFGRPLPRWADEGACTTVEHDSEKAKQEKFLITFLMTDRGIAFNKMFAMKEYPQDILPLYSQGYSLVRYLIQQGGKQKYVQFLGHGMKTNQWASAINKYYGFKDLSDLQVTWVEWVRAGSPDIDPASIAANEQPGDAIAATPVSAPPAAKVAVVSNNAPVPSSNSAATGYDRPTPPSSFNNTAAGRSQVPQASSVARPNSESFYAKPRDSRQQPTPAARPATYSTPTSRLAPTPNKQAGLSPDAEARQVLMEWSRPNNQPWNPGAVARNDAPQAWPNSTPVSTQAPQPEAGGYYAQPSVSARPTTVLPEGAATAWR